MPTLNLTEKRYVGITGIGGLLYATSSWGRKVVLRGDFPAPAIRIRTPERDVLYWDVVDIERWAEWWKHGRFTDSAPTPLPPKKKVRR